MTLWDKRVRGLFLAMVVFCPWAWLLLPPVYPKYYTLLFLIPVVYSAIRYYTIQKKEEEDYQLRVRERNERR